MELGPKLHRMNDDRHFVRIVVEDDHLEQPTRTIRADDEIAALSSNHPKGIRTAWSMSSSWIPRLRALSAIST